MRLRNSPITERAMNGYNSGFFMSLCRAAPNAGVKRQGLSEEQSLSA